ncbi:MAG: head-tail adaptor protein [Rhodobacteraceae bacterium]|nr:head-tail adaptor protein [Paracoccaceae bacterium]
MARVHLSRQLTLEQRRETPDQAGGFVVSWHALGVLWADVSARGGGRRAGQEVALTSVPYQIIVRAAPVGAASRPKPGQRFRDGGRVFLIEAVAEHDARGRYLICLTREEAWL